MKILIDGRPLTTTSAGIPNFLKCCISAWAKIMQESIFYVALPQPTDRTSADWELPYNVRLIIEHHSIFHKLPNLVWLNIVLPRLAKKYKIDLYFSALPCIPYFLPQRIKTIIVVHDVVNIEYKDTMQLSNRIANKMFFERSVKQADIIWTNSNYTREKVNRYFPKRKCQHIFVGDAAEDIFKPLSMSLEEKQKIKEELGIKQDFILFVGSLEPRKNLSFLLQLMPEFYKRTGLQLVIVGAKKWKNSQIKTIVEDAAFPKDSVVFCKFISNETLVKLYNIAKCYVSTSLNEGFGMPQLEAMQCRCPVVTAHNSAMIEIAEGKKGVYTVTGYDPATWIDHISEAINSGIKPTPDELRKYNWELILKEFTHQYL